MHLNHPNIISHAFKLIDVYEFDVRLGPEENGDQFSLRIELFQSSEDKTLFRRKAWRNELFRIQSSFPQDNTGKPCHDLSDEMILTGFSQAHFVWSDDFHVIDHQAARDKVKIDLGKLLEHITSIEVG
jgi:hypothetical protein